MEKVQIVGNLPQPAFKNLYPTPTAGKNNRKGEEVAAGLESVFTNDKLVYCKKCGFPCRLDRDERHPIYDQAGKGVQIVPGSEQRTVKDYETGGNITYYLQNAIVLAGCPCCGTYLYDV